MTDDRKTSAEAQADTQRWEQNLELRIASWSSSTALNEHRCDLLLTARGNLFDHGWTRTLHLSEGEPMDAVPCELTLHDAASPAARPARSTEAEADEGEPHGRRAAIGRLRYDDIMLQVRIGVAADAFEELRARRRDGRPLPAEVRLVLPEVPIRRVGQHDVVDIPEAA